MRRKVGFFSKSNLVFPGQNILWVIGSVQSSATLQSGGSHSFLRIYSKKKLKHKFSLNFRKQLCQNNSGAPNELSVFSLASCRMWEGACSKSGQNSMAAPEIPMKKAKLVRYSLWIWGSMREIKFFSKSNPIFPCQNIPWIVANAPKWYYIIFGRFS